MADRKSAEIFGSIFELISDNPSEDFKNLAENIYRQSKSYSFTSNQMYVDDALIKLDLAKEVLTEDGENRVAYKYDLNW